MKSGDDSEIRKPLSEAELLKLMGIAVSDYLKCNCPHCGQSIEYPAEGTGQTVPCPTCEKPVVLHSLPTSSGSIVIPSTTQLPQEAKTGKRAGSKLPNLTEETIRAKTKAGDTPLHRAAKNGQFDLIPSHLLSIELFTVTNEKGESPLHLAARLGTLNKVPRQFLTKETLTVLATPPYAPNGVYSTGSGYEARTETPLHIAALYGHADQIPKEFLTPEFLSIRAKGYRQTLLHYLAHGKSLDLVPPIYSNSSVWNEKDINAQTPRDLLESVVQQEAYVANARSEPATEKQIEKLRFFGCAFDKNITKGEASDALDKCARERPDVNQAYYNRPATEEQLAKVREINEHPDCGPDEPFYDFENEGPLTYGKAKDLIREWGWLRRTKENEEYEAYQKSDDSDDSRIDEAWMDIYHFRDCTRKQVAQAWSVVKSRTTDKRESPDSTELEDTMEELFPTFRPKEKDAVTYQCKDCGAIYKARSPMPDARNLSSFPPFTRDDFIQVTIACPSCGRDNNVRSVKVCKCICPHCSKECFVVKSQVGQSVKHFKEGCMKEFFTKPAEPIVVKPSIRLMQYPENPFRQNMQ